MPDKLALKSQRGLPAGVKAALELISPAAHLMDVIRTGVSVLRSNIPEHEDHSAAAHGDIADKLSCLAWVDAVLLGTTMRAIEGALRWRRMTIPSADTFCTFAPSAGAGCGLMRATCIADPLRRARVQRVDVYRTGNRRQRF